MLLLLLNMTHCGIYSGSGGTTRRFVHMLLILQWTVQRKRMNMLPWNTCLSWKGKVTALVNLALNTLADGGAEKHQPPKQNHTLNRPHVWSLWQQIWGILLLFLLWWGCLGVKQEDQLLLTRMASRKQEKLLGASHPSPKLEKEKINQAWSHIEVLGFG